MHDLSEVFDRIMNAHQLANKAKTHAKLLFSPPIARELVNSIDSLEEIKAIAPPGAKDKLCEAILAIEYVGNMPAEQPRLEEHQCNCGDTSRSVVAGLARIVFDLLSAAAGRVRGGPVVEAERRLNPGVSQPEGSDQQAA